MRFVNFEREPGAVPNVDRYRGLIVLGGPMNVEDQAQRPHLRTELRVIEQALKENRVKALVATSALGMGFDKPDLGFVVHLGAPSSAVRSRAGTSFRWATPTTRMPRSLRPRMRSRI